MTLKGILLKTLALLALAAVWSCGGDNSFRVTGTIEGIGTQNLNVVYYGDGAVRTMRTAVVDSKFMFDGKSRDWTVVYIFTNSRALIGRVIMRDGESAQVKFEPGNTAAIELKGNKPSEQLARWMRTNSALIDSLDHRALNEAVKTFVERNTDNVAAAAILTGFYSRELNPAEADSLYRLIDARYRLPQMTEGWADRLAAAQDTTRLRLPPTVELIDRHDSIVELNTRAGTLLIYAPADLERNKDIDKLLQAAAYKIKADTLNTRIIEIDRYVADTLQWKRSVDADSLPWTRLWHPVNSHIFPVATPRALIVADSTGRIVYNGDDLSAALKISHL